MSKRILYVEDNLPNMLLVKRLVEVQGYELLEANDGKTGWETAVNERPDLILMDLYLPGELDGFELTHRIKNHPELCHIPVVALTAYDNPTTQEKARAAGCDGFLVKPADIRQIRGAIQQFLATPAPALVSDTVLSTFVAAY